MKKFKWFAKFAIMLFLAVSMNGFTQEERSELNIIFTHDLHSHLESFNLEVDGTVEEVGGFAKIKTIIDEKKKEDPNTLVVDAGDFSMGTLYQTIYEEEASEVRMLGAMGFDVATFGNHELDYRDNKFSEMLKSAISSGDALPQFVLSNIDWEGASEELLAIKDIMEDYGVKPYTMITKGNINIAIFGIFGEESLKYAPMTELPFTNPVESAKETVKLIQENEEADIIICLSHSGISEIKKDSEDEILAEKVPEIDIIISGHSHTTLSEPIISGNTIIGSTGEYGIQIGSLTVKKAEDERWELANYELIPINDTIKEDKDTANLIKGFKSLIQESYLEQYGYEYDQVLANNPYNFTSIHKLGKEHVEEPLGNLLSDSYIYAVQEAEGEDYVPISVTVVPNGVIRDSFYVGDITVSDVFNVSSLGVGKDGIPGYPLMEVYLTGAELRTVAEVDASVSPLMEEARLNIGGLKFSFNPNRMILNKVTKVSLYSQVEESIEIVDEQLYRVVADLYSGQMLGAVADKSYGILSIIPKDRNGEPIKDLEDYIIYDGNRELKAWVAIAKYMESFDEAAGVSAIPSYYSETQNRKVVETSKNVVDLVKNPNKIAIIIYLIILLVIIMIAVIMILIGKKVRKVRRKKSTK